MGGRGASSSGGGGGISQNLDDEIDRDVFANDFRELSPEEKLATYGPGYSEHEMAALHGYKKWDYGYNYKLAKGERLDMGESRNVGNLDAVMSKSKLDRDITLYHGMGETEGRVFGELKSGDQFNVNAFMSTSKKYETGYGYAGESKKILVIHAPKGTKGYYYKDKGYEDEVLLPRKSAYKIQKVVQKDHGYVEYHVKPT